MRGLTGGPGDPEPRSRDGVTKEKLSPVQGCGMGGRGGSGGAGKPLPMVSGWGRPSPWAAAGAELRVGAL